MDPVVMIERYRLAENEGCRFDWLSGSGRKVYVRSSVDDLHVKEDVRVDDLKNFVGKLLNQL
ncbi:uncharacterized protein EAF02_012082 [Botrytis sinoallii]|uniref:uncharacterized protein n=1 Tax=Botrytis sinoallii TaxID=1463999 RepID=UPI001901A8F5|nr:uncharacterized protein EAF02_012082 [Botrytis sinoallii]KAF7853139.1 hypothetical protein EAF02_012082 [Botrytis sinoallii]